MPRRRPQVIAIHARDRVDADFLRTRILTLAEPCARAEALGVHLGDHRERTSIPLGLSLRQKPEMGDLRRGEKRRRAFGQAATHVPHPMQTAASMALSALSLGTRIAFASWASPVGAVMNPPA